MICPRTARFLLLASLALTASCGSQNSSGKGQAASLPHVLLISIDSLRADALGCYGAAGDVSPHIDALAAQGVLFEDALSSSSWTLPSHAALFTGLPDAAHGCDSNESRLSPQHETLAEHLSRAGYETAGFWSGPYLHPLFGLAQGFEQYTACTGFEVFGAKSLGDARRGDAPRGEARANARSHQDVTGPRVLEAFETYLDERSSTKPFFAFVHLWDVHYDYIAPTEWRERFAKADYDGPMDGSARAIYEATRGVRPGAPAAGLTQADVEQVRALYAAEVAWTDHHVGALLERLREEGLLENTIVVLTADHGEEFFEHGRFGHRKQLFIESVHVPLIVRLPETSEPGRRLDLSVGGSDLAPTLLELLGFESPTSMTGTSFARALQGRDESTNRAPVLSELVRLSGRGRVATARNSDWSLLFDVESDKVLGFWDRRQDRAEERDLSGDETQERPQALLDLFENSTLLLERLRQKHRPEDSAGGPLPAELEQQLRDLGYISD